MKRSISILITFMIQLSVLSIYGIDETEGDNKNNPTPVLNLNLHDYTLKSLSLSATPPPASTSVSLSSRGLVFLIAPNYSMIHNGDIFSDASWNAKGGFGFNVEVDYFTKITRNGLVKFGFGIGYSQYKSEISLESASMEIPNSIDIDEQEFVKIVEVNQLTESLSLGYFDIPLYIEIGNANIDKIGGYGRIGFKVSIPVTSKLEGSGTYSAQGFYEDCPVLLHGIPELGFYTDEPIHNNQEDLKLKSVVFSVLLSGGVTFPLSNTLILKLGANINFGLTEISDTKSNNNDFEPQGNYSKILNSPSATTIRSYGLEIGLIYTLRLD